MYEFTKDEQKIVYNEDDYFVTTTKDQEQTNLENQGYVALDIPSLQGATLLDIHYENVWYGDSLENSNIIVSFRLANKEIRRWCIQADEENNRGGYISEYDIEGNMITNEEQGKRRKKLNA